jgi:hypothetical protein
MARTIGLRFNHFDPRTFCPLYSIGGLAAGPVINICTIASGCLIYQFAEAATKFHIKDFFDAIRAHAFLMRQRIKLAFQ